MDVSACRKREKAKRYHASLLSHGLFTSRFIHLRLFRTRHPLWLIVKYSSEVLDGLITKTMTPWRTCSLQEQNEEFSKPAPASGDANTMRKDNLYVQAI